MVRYWDLAATEKTARNDPDWTVGIKLGRDRNGGYWLLDVNPNAGPRSRRVFPFGGEEAGRGHGDDKRRSGNG